MLDMLINILLIMPFGSGQQILRPWREHITVSYGQPLPTPIDRITAVSPDIDTRRDPAL
jgi:hypothetical protein